MSAQETVRAYDWYGIDARTDAGLGSGAEDEDRGSKLKWWEAAETVGITDRTTRRWRERSEEHGYSGLCDHCKRVRVRSALP